jgi:hypothetical protein
MSKNDRNSITASVVDAGTGVRIITSELMLLRQLKHGEAPSVNKRSSDIAVVKKESLQPPTPRGSDSIFDMGTQLLIINAELKGMQGHLCGRKDNAKVKQANGSIPN